jgi:hypothetical protein
MNAKKSAPQDGALIHVKRPDYGNVTSTTTELELPPLL